MLTLEYSRKPLKLMMKLWKQTLSTCLDLQDSIFEWDNNFV